MTAIDTMIDQAKNLLANLEAYKRDKAEADRQTVDLVRHLEDGADKVDGEAEPRPAVAVLGDWQH